MSNLNTTGHYRDIAHNLYENHIFKDILKYSDKSEVVYRDAYLYYLRPQASGSRLTRYYPSALFLIICKALDPDNQDYSLHSIAAAVEILHASTLIIDDFVDSHNSRRGAPSLRANYNDNIAILVAHQHLAHCLTIVSEISNSNFRLVSEFLSAMREGYWGGFCDEPESWSAIHPNDLSGYWHSTTHKKQVVGHLAARLAVIASGQMDYMEQIVSIEADMAFIAQLLNDTGDIFGFRGFQATVSDIRQAGKEAAIKPLHPQIWLKNCGISIEQDIDFIQLRRLLYEHGYLHSLVEQVQERKKHATAELNKLNLSPSRFLNALADFIQSPNVPPSLLKTQNNI